MTEKIEMSEEQWALFKTFSKDIETRLTPLGFIKTVDGQPKRSYLDEEIYSDYFEGLTFTKDNIRLVFTYNIPDELWSDDSSPSWGCEFQTDETEHIKKEEHFDYFDIMGTKGRWPFRKSFDFDEFDKTFLNWLSECKATADRLYQDHISLFPSARSHGKRYKIVEVNDAGQIQDTEVIIAADNKLIYPSTFVNKIKRITLSKGR
jgi:hypothetical protein